MTEVDVSDVVGEWQAHLDEEGNEFFYNEGTGESTYERPA